MSALKSWKSKPRWIRFFHWEYWSFNTVYFAIYPVFLFLCLRARSLFFFSASNPTIQNGGFLAESKKDIYRLVPPELQPRTLFFDRGTDPVSATNQLEQSGFSFPMIGKPDIGGRGRAIKKLDDAASLSSYVRSVPFDFHIQEFVAYPNELGIFYNRYPGNESGNITGIVKKEFLKVTGDGKQNIRTLLGSNPRGILQLAHLEITDPEILEQIPEDGLTVTVSPYGNHARGALFLDESASVNDALLSTMDDLCKRIPGFHYGRLDIRYESRALLEHGMAFSVIEVNGAGSEPTHMYDPRHSIFFAWKEIIRHWIILFRISRANHRLGHPYLSFSEGVAMFSKDKTNSALLDKV